MGSRWEIDIELEPPAKIGYRIMKMILGGMMGITAAILGYFLCIPLGILMHGIFQVLDGQSFHTSSGVCSISNSVSLWVGCFGLGLFGFACITVFVLPFLVMFALRKTYNRSPFPCCSNL